MFSQLVLLQNYVLLSLGKTHKVPHFRIISHKNAIGRFAYTIKILLNNDIIIKEGIKSMIDTMYIQINRNGNDGLPEIVLLILPPKLKWQSSELKWQRDAELMSFTLPLIANDG